MKTAFFSAFTISFPTLVMNMFTIPFGPWSWIKSFNSSNREIGSPSFVPFTFKMRSSIPEAIVWRCQRHYFFRSCELKFLTFYSKNLAGACFKKKLSVVVFYSFRHCCIVKPDVVERVVFVVKSVEKRLNLRKKDWTYVKKFCKLRWKQSNHSFPSFL